MVLNCCCRYHWFYLSNDGCGGLILGQHGLYRVAERLGDEDVLLGRSEDVLVAHLGLQDFFINAPTPTVKVPVVLFFLALAFGISRRRGHLLTSFLVFNAFMFSLGEGLHPLDRVELSEGVPALVAAF